MDPDPDPLVRCADPDLHKNVTDPQHCHILQDFLKSISQNVDFRQTGLAKEEQKIPVVTKTLNKVLKLKQKKINA